MIRPIPLCRVTVVAELVTDILDAAEHGEQYLPRSLVLRAEIAGKALRVFASTPVGREPHKAFAVETSALTCLMHS
jgi:hypothetical protein